MLFFLGTNIKSCYRLSVPIIAVLKVLTAFLFFSGSYLYLFTVAGLEDRRFSVVNYGPYTQPGSYNVTANVTNAITKEGEIFTCILNVQIPPVNVQGKVSAPVCTCYGTNGSCALTDISITLHSEVHRVAWSRTSDHPLQPSRHSSRSRNQSALRKLVDYRQSLIPLYDEFSEVEIIFVHFESFDQRKFFLQIEGQAWIGSRATPLEACLSISNGTDVKYLWNRGQSGDTDTTSNCK